MVQRTYTIADALTIVAPYFPRLQADSIGAMLCDMAQSYVWDYADWRQTVAEFDPFYLVPFEQDYTAPQIVVPSDFQGFRQAYSVVSSTEPAYKTPLKVRKQLDSTPYSGEPELISYEPELVAFRVYPRTSESMGAADWMVTGTYKKAPVKITAATVPTTLIPFDDRFFQAYVETLRWMFMLSSSDPRAGGMQYNKAARTYVATGQFALVMSLLTEMTEKEGLDLGDDAISPSEPLINRSIF